MNLTASFICRALKDDANPNSGWMRNSHGRTVEPRTEVWLADARVWVRANGRSASGWPGLVHSLEFFGPISAWRIRRAVRAWAARRALA